MKTIFIFFSLLITLSLGAQEVKKDGKVYEVKNCTTKRKFALKTINKAMFKDNIKSVMGIHDEISLLRKIRHPNVL